MAEKQFKKDNDDDMLEKLVAVNRVAKTVKGVKEIINYVIVKE